jgi:lysophospholipase L1-like esterase
MEWTHGRVVYAALGDSMSIDDYAGGPARGAASLLWRNRDDDFPTWAGRDLTARDPTARLVLLASDGATSTTVAGEQLGRLRRLGSIPTVATVTMGGNDLLAAYGDATAARRAIQTVADNGRRRFRGRVCDQAGAGQGHGLPRAGCRCPGGVGCRRRGLRRQPRPAGRA